MRLKLRRANEQLRKAIATVADILIAIGRAIGPRTMVAGWGAVLLYWGLGRVYEPAAPIVLGSLLLAAAAWPLIRKVN